MICKRQRASIVYRERKKITCAFSTQFESDLQKVKIERLRSAKTLEEYMEVFERKKTQDFRVCAAVV